MNRYARLPTMRWLLKMMTPGITPYCIPHVNKCFNSISDIRKEIMFNKWVNQPTNAKTLYWYLHPEEYKKTVGCYPRDNHVFIKMIW